MSDIDSTRRAAPETGRSVAQAVGGPKRPEAPATPERPGDRPGATAAAPAARGRGLLLPLLGLIGLLAYLEEGVWDGLVWREHGRVFGWFQSLPTVADPAVLAWLVPLLALPQATHYVLDGFIWRRPAAGAAAPVAEAPPARTFEPA